MLRKNNKGEYTPYSANKQQGLSYPYIRMDRLSDPVSTVIKDLPKGEIPLVYVEGENTFIVATVDYDPEHLNWMLKWCALSAHISKSEVIELSNTRLLINSLVKIKELRGGE